MTWWPATIYFPDDAFALIGTGANYRVPTHQLLNAGSAADPNCEILGPYVNGDVGTDLIQCRNIVGVPHCYMRHFLPGPLTPCLAWELVAHDITANGDAAHCGSLINFLCLACTIHAAGDTASPLARGPLDVPISDAHLIRHRTALIQHKLPGLNQTPTLAAGQAIAASVSKLATEQQAYRQDMADRHAQTTLKTVDEYFGASLLTLLKICNVGTVAALPPPPNLPVLG
jgi:hypothetical protein